MQGAKGCKQQALQRRSALRTCVQGQQQRSCRLRMRCSQRVSSCRKGLNQTFLQAFQLQMHPSRSHGSGTDHWPAGIQAGSTGGSFVAWALLWTDRLGCWTLQQGEYPHTDLEEGSVL